MAKFLQIVRRAPGDTLPHRESDLELDPYRNSQCSSSLIRTDMCENLAALGAGVLPNSSRAELDQSRPNSVPGERRCSSRSILDVINA